MIMYADSVGRKTTAKTVTFYTKVCVCVYVNITLGNDFTPIFTSSDRVRTHYTTNGGGRGEGKRFNVVKADVYIYIYICITVLYIVLRFLYMVLNKTYITSSCFSASYTTMGEGGIYKATETVYRIQQSAPKKKIKINCSFEN